MSKELGDTLIAKGLLTQEQLDEALQTQLISGGHLGTSLLDLGFIDEPVLGETLAQMQRLSLATREMLRKVSRRVIKLLPSELAEKHLAVPIKVEDKTLHVAVADPKKLSELSAKTGYKIVPWVSPEIRIYEALETHYGIPRRPRYLRLCKEIDGKQQKARKSASAGPEKAQPTRDADLRNCDPKAGSEVIIEMPGADYGYGQDWRVVAERLELQKKSPKKTPAKKSRRKKPGSRTKTGSRKSPSRRLEDVLDLLCQADSKEDIAAAYLDSVSSTLKTCMLLSVKSQIVRVWDHRGLDLEPETIDGLRWTLTAGSIFRLLLGNTHYQGPIPDDAGCQHFYATLRMDPPAEALLCPVYVNDRLIVITYGDAGPAKIKGSIDTYLLLGEKLSLAMRLLILKTKIRAV